MIRCIALQHQKSPQKPAKKQPGHSNLTGIRSLQLSTLESTGLGGCLMETAETTLEVGTRKFRANVAQLENAVVAFLFEDKMRLGTMAIAMPGLREVAAGRSSVLVGGKYLMTTRALAEKLAAKSGRIALVSLFTELDEAEALRTYTKLLEKVQVTRPVVDAARELSSSIRQDV